jgi:hypothetical protein
MYVCVLVSRLTFQRIMYTHNCCCHVARDFEMRNVGRPRCSKKNRIFVNEKEMCQQIFNDVSVLVFAPHKKVPSRVSNFGFEHQHFGLRAQIALLSLDYILRIANGNI